MESVHFPQLTGFSEDFACWWKWQASVMVGMFSKHRSCMKHESRAHYPRMHEIMRWSPPRHNKIWDMRWWKQAIMAVQACITGYDRNLKSFQNWCATIITPEMASSHPTTQVRMRFRRSDTIKSGKVSVVFHRLFPKYARGSYFTQHREEAETAFSSTRQGFNQKL